MGYTDQFESNFLTLIPEILMIGAIILCGIMALKVTYEHFSDSSRTGRSFMVDVAYAMIVPAVLFGIGGFITLLPIIQSAFA